MSEFKSKIWPMGASPGAQPLNPTFAELRAKVTEAEAAVGRAVYEGKHWSHAEYVRRIPPLESAMIAALEALRQAEEAERKPRLASVAQLQSWVHPMRDRDDELVRHTRGDMLAAIKALIQRNRSHQSSEVCAFASDIEALLREAE